MGVTIVAVVGGGLVAAVMLVGVVKVLSLFIGEE